MPLHGMAMHDRSRLLATWAWFTCLTVLLGPLPLPLPLPLPPPPFPPLHNLYCSGHAMEIVCLAVHPHSALLATGSMDQTARVSG